MTTKELIDELERRDLLTMATKHAFARHCSLAEMLGASHERAPAWARQALWAELYSLGHWSYPRLGRLFNRHHTVIMAGIRAHHSRAGIAA